MTIETINLVKKELINPAGKFFNEYTKLITNDADVYQIMKDVISVHFSY